MSISIQAESARCLLCHEAPCTLSCPHDQDPARFVRALRFDRLHTSLEYVAGCNDCLKTHGDKPPCVTSCIHFDAPIRIPQLRRDIMEKNGVDSSSILNVPDTSTIDLSIDFCGVHCENPFFLSSSVVASGYEMCAQALKMGWAGIVYKTIGVLTPNEVSPRFDAIGKEGTPFIGFRNLEQISDTPLEENLKILKKLKQDFPTKVIVSSIMGETDDEWTLLAKLSEEAGVDIIECNFSCPHMSGENLGSDVGENPALVAQYVRAVRKGTRLPILAKMTPNTGSMVIVADAAIQAGADGIAAINTIKSITGLEITDLSPPPSIEGKSAVSGYSGKAVKPIALRFIHDLAKYPLLAGVPISGMGGIETWKDALEFILLGSSNIQVTTSVMQYGYRIIDDMIAGLKEYMQSEGVSCVSDLVGKALPSMVNAESLDRSSIMFPKFIEKTCIGCGRCVISCSDGGHQAIEFGENRKPKFIAKNCVGCHLCLYVCPVGAIEKGKRFPKESIK